MAAMAPAAGASIRPVAVTLTPLGARRLHGQPRDRHHVHPLAAATATKDLTLQLPPGLLANAAVDGGACLKSATPIAACQVGSGTVTANILGGPASGRRCRRPSTSSRRASQADLAGLAVLVTARRRPADPARHARRRHDPPGHRPGRRRAQHRLRQHPRHLRRPPAPASRDQQHVQRPALPGHAARPRPANVTVTADSYSDRGPDHRRRAADGHGLRLGALLARILGVGDRGCRTTTAPPSPPTSPRPPTRPPAARCPWPSRPTRSCPTWVSRRAVRQPGLGDVHAGGRRRGGHAAVPDAAVRQRLPHRLARPRRR